MDHWYWLTMYPNDDAICYSKSLCRSKRCDPTRIIVGHGKIARSKFSMNEVIVDSLVNTARRPSSDLCGSLAEQIKVLQ